MSQAFLGVALKRRGTIIRFNGERGFGFIAPDSGTGDLFFHVSTIEGERHGVTAGEEVHYEIGLDKNGRFEAKRVWRSVARSVEKRPVGAGVLIALTLAFWFIAGIAILAVIGRTSFWMAVYYAVISIICFLVYAGDKKSAQSGGQRTSERALHFLDLLGGWPGGIVAQQAKRHKVRKAEFMALTALIVCMHVLGWTWLALSGRTFYLDLHERTLNQPIEQPDDDWSRGN